MICIFKHLHFMNNKLKGNFLLFSLKQFSNFPKLITFLFKEESCNFLSSSSRPLLSLTHTLTHRYTHTDTDTDTYTHTHTHSLSLPHTWHSLFLSHTLTHAHTLAISTSFHLYPSFSPFFSFLLFRFDLSSSFFSSKTKFELQTRIVKTSPFLSQSLSLYFSVFGGGFSV